MYFVYFLYLCPDDSDNLEEIIHDVMTKTTESDNLERESRNVDLLIISQDDVILCCYCRRSTISKFDQSATHRVAPSGSSKQDALCDYCRNNCLSQPTINVGRRVNDSSWPTTRPQQQHLARKTESFSTNGQSAASKRLENNATSRQRVAVTAFKKKSLIINRATLK